MAQFSFSVKHISGKFLIPADTLSRLIDGGDDEEGEGGIAQIECPRGNLGEGGNPPSVNPPGTITLPVVWEAKREDPACRILRDFLGGNIDFTTIQEREFPPDTRALLQIARKGELMLEIRADKSSPDPEKSKYEVIVKKGSIRNRVYIPEPLRDPFIWIVHAEGHYGITKTTQTLAGRVWWPSLPGDVANTIRTCLVCLEKFKINPHVSR